MNIMIVDDEKLAISVLETTVKRVVPEAMVMSFQRPFEAIEKAETMQFHVAFLDIKMRETNGIAVAKKLKLLSPEINIIFTTGYSEYALTALSLHASGYLMKPISEEMVRDELNSLRNPPEIPTLKNIKISTFGNFEVYANGKQVKFARSKTKELLAYLVDRHGAFCSDGEIIGVLWEDEPVSANRRSYLRNLYADLIKILDDVGCGRVIKKRRGEIAVDPGRIDCDYFDWLDGKLSAINRYKGEYMAQYSWGEYTIGKLEEK